jgi:hypothetical protein
MEVIQVFDRPAYQSFYTVAGRLLFVESFDRQLAQLIERLFAGWQLTPVSSPQRSPEIHIQFTCGHALPQIPNNLNRFDIAEGGQAFTDGSDLYLSLRNCRVEVRNGSPVAVKVSLEELPQPEDPIASRLASFAVCASLRRFGLFELHSACMIQPVGEKGVLIIGPSGSGKSTLALQLAIEGWPYLSDDEVLLSLNDGKVEARGFRSFFAVTAATASTLGLQPAIESFKTCFEPDAVVSSSRRTSASPGLLLFTQLSGDPKSQLNELSQTEAMKRLIRYCPWASYDTAIAGANLEVLSRLARQTTAFELLAGRGLLEPGCASALLSSL